MVVRYRWENEAMTHDPLCFSDDDPYNCDCDLIAKVRADEKAKWTHTCDGNNCCHQPGE